MKFFNSKFTLFFSPFHHASINNVLISSLDSKFKNLKLLYKDDLAMCYSIQLLVPDLLLNQVNSNQTQATISTYPCLTVFFIEKLKKKN